ncbi:MAG TPA: hypothetical protein VGH38_12600 [Bryobacteraceae bacterium]|jgi:hypothetical protein
MRIWWTMQAQQDLIETPGGEAIREELDRLLASTYFNQSRRFPNFLRFVVEHTLAGDVDHIKERTLGIEIFGRDADYDTASDPIVRVTAAEIRKRVAQYYQDPAHRHELRISLPSGSYVPHFHWPSAEVLPPAPEQHTIVEVAVEPVDTTPRFPIRLLRWAVVAAIVLVAMTAVILTWQRNQRSAFDSFWQPILSPQEPVLLCIADQLEYSVIQLRDASDPSHQFVLKDNLTAIVMDDLDAVVRVAGILQARGKQYALQGEGATNLDQLRRSPTVFVGAFDNAWTLRLTRSLRYHFANNADMTRLWIEDSMAPGQARWVVDRNVQLATNNYRDYALIARFTDSNTGNVEVVIAGIGRGGTRVAGEFLTQNADLAQLMRAARQAGDKKNMEAVLSTEIIGGEPGTPKMEAVYFW